MRKWCFSSVLVLAAVLVGASANAEPLDGSELTARVPFQFVVGTTILPAGQYEIRASTMDPAVVWLVSPNGEHVVVTSTVWGGDAFRGSHADLAFEVYGNVRFLERIDVPGEAERDVPLTRQEVEQGLAQQARNEYEQAHANG